MNFSSIVQISLLFHINFTNIFLVKYGNTFIIHTSKLSAFSLFFLSLPLPTISVCLLAIKDPISKLGNPSYNFYHHATTKLYLILISYYICCCWFQCGSNVYGVVVLRVFIVRYFFIFGRFFCERWKAFLLLTYICLQRYWPAIDTNLLQSIMVFYSKALVFHVSLLAILQQRAASK